MCKKKISYEVVFSPFMRFSLSIIAIIFAFWLACPQALTGQNPFELKWRKGSDQETALNSQPPRPGSFTDSSTDIKPADPVLVLPPSPPIKKEEIPEVTPPVPAEVTIDTQPSEDSQPEELAADTSDQLDAFIDKKLKENPFEVTRIISNEAIRKRQAGKKKLTESEKPAEKSVDKPVKAEDASPKAELKYDDKPRGISNTGYLAVFACVLLLLTFVVNMNRGFLKKIYKAVLNENYSSLLYRERKFSSIMLLYYISYAIFFINGGLFLFLIAHQNNWTIGGSTTLLTSIGLVAGIYIARHLIMNVLSAIFPISKEVNQYNFNILLFNILLGLVLLPVNLLLAFGPEEMNFTMVIIGGVSVGLFYLLRQFRGLLISNRLIADSPFHFFVYLCTIEILPVLILLKFF